jgi:hypothetical protein
MTEDGAATGGHTRQTSECLMREPLQEQCPAMTWWPSDPKHQWLLFIVAVLLGMIVTNLLGRLF